jgi:hypothetical protein
MEDPNNNEPGEEKKLGKIVATYLVRVTLREHTDGSSPEEAQPPTNVAVEGTIEFAFQEDYPEYTVNATAEQT